MKRIFSAMAAVLISLSMMIPAFAVEGTFVPSISDKGAPDIETIVTPEGDTALGVIYYPDSTVAGYPLEECLVVTPISQAKTSTRIPEDSRQTLLDVYDQLVSGSMKLPYEAFNQNLDADKMVIRDLFDASWLCEEHDELLKEEGNTLELTFDLGVDADTEVYVMTYIDGQWKPVVSAVNNGDGTVTCVFEDICPIAFCVETDAIVNAPQTGDVDGSNLGLWIALMTVSAAALLVTVVYLRKVMKN